MQSPLLGVSEALRVIGETLDGYFNNKVEHAEPDPESKAARERRSRAGAADGAGTMLAAAWVWTTLGIPSDHLQATSRLISPDRERASVHRFAVLSLLRVTLELSALCWWLIDPKITARTRMQRTLLYERWSLDQVERADGYLSRVDAESECQKEARRAFQARIDQLAEEHNLQKIRSGSREIPNASDLVGNQFQAMAGLSADARNIYSRLSEVTHGNMYGTLAGYSRPPDQDQLTGPSVPIWLVTVGAQYAAFGFCHAVSTFIDFMGWDTGSWEESTEQALLNLEAIAHSINASAVAERDA